MRISRVLSLPLLCALFTASVAHAINDGDAAPNVVLVSQSSSELNLASYAGKVVYLDFWASWCGPCKKSLQWMNTLQKKFDPAHFQIIAVNLDDSKADAERALREVTQNGEIASNFSVIYDPAGAIPERYGVTAMPSSFLIDQQGKIVSSEKGFSSERADEIAARIAQLLTGKS